MRMMKKEEGYNVCPRCGKAPYEMMGDYETYHVGCSYCGIKNGVTSFLEFPLDDEVRGATQKEWNEQCLKAHYTEKRYLTACRAVINMAVANGVVGANPIVGSLRYPRFDPVNVDYLGDDALKIIVKDLENKVAVYPPRVTLNDVLVAIGIFAGPRRGEMVALQWRDFVGLDDNADDAVQISICRSAYKVADEKQKIETTKTYRSTRMFTIPKLLAEVLIAWKEVLRRNHIPTDPHNFVLPNEYGGMVSVYSPTRWFKDYLEEHHLKDVKLHSLRHTFASLLLSRGMELYTLKKLMGHKHLKTTEMYLHLFEMRKKDLMSGVNEYVQTIKREWGLLKLGVPKWLAHKVANWGDHYQFVATKSVLARAVSKEKLTKRGLVSLSDYYLKVAHS